MATFTPAVPMHHTIRAATLILGFALVVGFTDNFVQVIARDAGLWQFHATRTAMGLVLLGLATGLFGWRLRPARAGAVAVRSALHATAMVIYFGCLGFLPVATVAAGLFTAPIFTLVISRLAFGIPIGPFRIAAVLVGFAGALLVLGPGQGTAAGPATVLPIVAGGLYALGNIATRQWCEGETAGTLLMGFFAALGLFGLIGMAVLALWQPVVPDGAEGFILRGAVRPSAGFLFWTFVQAAGSLLGVGMMIRAYQIAEASRVAIFEYVILPASALWAYLLWGDILGGQAALGIVMIFAAGLIIALRGR